jgi:hypothetical protein
MDLSGYMKTPTGGTTGQILTKTDDGYNWADAPTSTTITGSTNKVSDTNTPESYTISGKNTSNTDTSGIVYSKDAVDNWLSWVDI